MGIFTKRGRKAVNEASEREDLVRALQAHPRTRFSANDLHKLTGVEKISVRGLLEDVPHVVIKEGKPRTFAWTGPPRPTTASGREPVDE